MEIKLDINVMIDYYTSIKDEVKRKNTYKLRYIYLWL